MGLGGASLIPFVALLVGILLLLATLLLVGRRGLGAGGEKTRWCWGTTAVSGVGNSGGGRSREQRRRPERVTSAVAGAGDNGRDHSGSAAGAGRKP